MKLTRPNVRVKFFELFKKMNAYKNSFHANRSVKIATDVMPGPEIGRITRRNAESVEQPSIIAASSSSLGIVSKYPFSIQVAVGSPKAKYVMIKPLRRSSRLTLLIIKNIGI